MTSPTPSPISDQAAGEPKCTCAVRFMPGHIGATHSEDCPITAWVRAVFKASGENASGLSTAPTTGSAPDGYALVPVRMTADMINAWSGGLTASSDELAYRTTFQAAWARVLEAAPTSPAASVLTDSQIIAMASQFIIDSGQDFDMVGYGRALLAASMAGEKS